MDELLPYVRELEQQILTQRLSWTRWTKWCDVSLNSGAALELRQAAGLRAQKRQGAFFTGASLAERAVSALGMSVQDSCRYFDPTCGAGDLLLAIARKMNIGATVAETLSQWGNRLVGCDISPVFVRAARARLALLAMRRVGCRESLTSRELAEAFPSITTADIRNCTDLYSQSDRIVMNPPYTLVNVSDKYVWSTGLTNAAACFAADAIVHCKAGARIVAILPDVLRSGTRYERWRTMVEKFASIVDVRGLHPWSTKLRVSETRRFKGRLFEPPFVAIRRTSSPRDGRRAVATTVLGQEDVAVENHIIVCTPRDRSVESCQKFVARLMSQKTDEWLNERIRCRHLTLGAVGRLPWWSGE